MKINSVKSTNYQPKSNICKPKVKNQNVNFKGDGKALLYGTGALAAMSIATTLFPVLAPISIPIVALAAQAGNKK